MTTTESLSREYTQSIPKRQLKLIEIFGLTNDKFRNFLQIREQPQIETDLKATNLNILSEDPDHIE